MTSLSSFVQSSGTAGATSLGFVYGIPILLVGCALKYAELDPIELISSTEAAEARERCGTDTQKKIHSDITRHRYGDEAHMAEALSSLGLIPRGEPCPVLESGVERQVGGEYEIELFFVSVATAFGEWEDRIERMERFFGPRVSVTVRKVDKERRVVGVAIRSISAA